jgi:hypothetical protein
MTDESPGEPPVPPVEIRKSNSLTPSRTKMKLDAWTDWFIVACATLLTVLDKFPPEWTAGIFVGVAGLAGLARKLGGTGTATGVLLGFGKKLAVAIGLTAILFGCSPAALQTGATIARELLLPAAKAALRAEAEKRNVTIDEAGAVCFEAPSVDLNLPEFDGLDLVALICVAPVVE